MKRLASQANIAPDTRQQKKRKEIVWVSPSSLRNYMLDDPCIDWLKAAGVVSGESGEASPDSFLSHLMAQGCQFEEKVVQYIRDLCGENEFRQIIDNPRDITFDADLKYAETIQAMEDKVAVIYQGYLQDTDRHLRGIPDLLVRSDFLGRIIDNPPKINARDRDSSASYVVIDIKFSTLHFRAREDTLQNSGVMLAYKAQVIFYNELLALALPRTSRAPTHAYLLGRAWKRNNRGVNHCFDKLGIVDPTGVDEEIREKMWRAVKWIKDLKINAKKWWQEYSERDSEEEPLPRPELYPNMCKTGFYDKEKKSLAMAIKEITLIWNCGFKHRAAAHGLGVYSWDDPDCTIETLGIKPTERGKVIEKMLDFHRSGELIWPRKTSKMQNTLGWKKPGKPNAPDYYLDFEFLTNVFDDFGEFPNVGGEEYLYLIGIYSGGKYRHFMMKELTDEEEERNLLAFLDFYERAPGRIFHWGHIEESLLNRLKRSFPAAIKKRIQKVIDKLVDFTAVLRETPILVRGAFGFGLKEYAGAMVKNGQISATWEGSLKGDSSLVKAKQYYEKNANKNKDANIAEELIAYNHDDCQITCEIISYLRNLK